MLTLSKLNIEFNEGVIKTHLIGQDLKDLYNFVRGAFLDGVLPVTKIVGFKLEDNASLSTGSLLDRCNNILNNNLEISAKLESLCFIGSGGLAIIDVEGDVTSYHIQDAILYDDLELVNEETEIYRINQVDDGPLTESNGLFSDYSNSGNVVLKVIFRQSSGFHNMTDNLTYMLKEFNDKDDMLGERIMISEFMPINSNHSLSKFIRFYPFVENSTEIRYSSPLDSSLLNKLWKLFLEILRKEGVEE